MVRLKDIAEQAGVSAMTVSRVLRGIPGVSATTKARIDQIARRMGYVPDASARSLRTRTTQLVGIVLPSIADPLATASLASISRLLGDLGYEVLIAQTFHHCEREDDCLRRLLSRRIDGLLVWPAHRLAPAAPAYDEVRDRHLPVVILGPVPPFAMDLSSVSIDERAAGHAATRHLLNLGHSRIAFLSGRANSAAAQQRLEGYRHALREARLDVEDRFVFNAGESLDGGKRTARQLVEERTEATAVVAANDLVAIGAAEQLLGHGVRIPEALSIVGYGDLDAGRHFKVPLTTVRCGDGSLAQAAVDALILASARGTPAEVRLPVEVQPRASTCRVPATSRE